MAVPSSPEVDDIVVTLDDIERLGRAKLDPVSGAYFNSGADLEQTLNENQTAYLRLRLRPRVLRNVAQRNMEVTLLGDQRLSMPLAISPTAFQKMADSDGELATARAARRAGTLMVLSIYSTTSFEDVRQAAPEGLQWFQLYISPDREITKTLVIRAEKAGYRALVVTVDTQLPGKISSKARIGFKPPRVPKCVGFWHQSSTLF
ncbi:hydroxyacid oxidase 1 [Ixodes scapularis]